VASLEGVIQLGHGAIAILKWGRRKKTDQGGKIMLVLAHKDHDLWKNIPTK
jgi:hypothetical protein